MNLFLLVLNIVLHIKMILQDAITETIPILDKAGIWLVKTVWLVNGPNFK